MTKQLVNWRQNAKEVISSYQAQITASVETNKEVKTHRKTHVYITSSMNLCTTYMFFNVTSFIA